jgi:bifunctional DNA-binding transcriptional regulator/antitoxin component of YhaV-PrlF toxin-antitoxin module
MTEIAISVASNGKVVLPVDLRRRLNVVRGGVLVIRDEGDRLVLENADEAIARAQAIVRRFAPDAVGVVEELSAERRAEVEREAG